MNKATVHLTENISLTEDSRGETLVIIECKMAAGALRALADSFGRDTYTGDGRPDWRPENPEAMVTGDLVLAAPVYNRRLAGKKLWSFPVRVADEHFGFGYRDDRRDSEVPWFTLDRPALFDGDTAELPGLLDLAAEAVTLRKVTKIISDHDGSPAAE